MVCLPNGSSEGIRALPTNVSLLTTITALLVGKVQPTLNFPYIVNCNSSPTPDLKTLTRDPPRFLRSEVS